MTEKRTIPTVKSAMLACEQWCANVNGMTSGQKRHNADDVIALGRIKIEVLLLAIDAEKTAKPKKPRGKSAGKASSNGE